MESWAVDEFAATKNYLHVPGVGLGIRSQRFAMVVEDGVVKTLNVEQPGAFEVSSAEAMLETL